MFAAATQTDHDRGKRSARRGQGPCGLFGHRIVAGWLGVVATALVLLWSSNAVAGEPRVLMLRGWFGVFSTGLDTLADALKAKGVDAEVAGHLHWRTAVSEILKERAAGTTRPIVLVGHSQGANNVIDIARSLQAHKVPVDLVVTLAPFMQDPVPANVVRAVNYYQSPGWGAPITADPGFEGELVNVDVSSDWSITHISIDKSARVHADVSREVAALSSERTIAGRRSAAARSR